MIDAKKQIQEVMEVAREAIRAELKAQGHIATGKLYNSMRIEIVEDGKGYIGRLWVQDYYVNIEFRMGPGSVPYTRGSGKSSSQMIMGLFKHWQRLGVANPLAASFATANVWKKEGRPTRASFKYSSNGRRTGFMEHGVKAFREKADELITEGYAEATRFHMRSIVNGLDQLDLKTA